MVKILKALPRAVADQAYVMNKQYLWKQYLKTEVGKDKVICEKI